MNERILELAKKAGLKFPSETAMSLVELKFAELIIRECADQCDMLLNDKMSSEWARGTHDCAKAIREHFGVE